MSERRRAFFFFDASLIEHPPTAFFCRPMILCLFEDQHVKNLYPLALTHHPAMLLVGAGALHQRAQSLLAVSAVTWAGRPLIEKVLQSRGHTIQQPTAATDTLYLNGRLRWRNDLPTLLPTAGESEWVMTDGTAILAARTSQLASETLLGSTPEQWQGLGLAVLQTDELKLYNYLWELI